MSEFRNSELIEASGSIVIMVFHSYGMHYGCMYFGFLEIPSGFYEERSHRSGGDHNYSLCPALCSRGVRLGGDVINRRHEW